MSIKRWQAVLMVSLSWKFVGDAIFTVVIIYSLVVVFWRGTWTFLDVIFTTDPKKKILWTFCVYVGIQVMLSLLHYPKRKFASIVERKSFILKYILENIVTSFMGIASVSFWKAIWNFLSIYYIPEHKHLAAWSAHAIGYVGLVLCLSCKSVPPPGFSKDGDLENGEISSQTLDAVQRLNKFCASLPKGKSKTECRETVEVVITEITHL